MLARLRLLVIKGDIRDLKNHYVPLYFFLDNRPNFDGIKPLGGVALDQRIKILLDGRMDFGDRNLHYFILLIFLGHRCGILIGVKRASILPSLPHGHWVLFSIVAATGAPIVLGHAGRGLRIDAKVGDRGRLRANVTML